MGTATPVVNSNQLQALTEVCSSVSAVAESLINPIPGPVMNSLVSEKKVICNDSIPNPITPIPIPIKLPMETSTKSITILSGARIKLSSKEKVDSKNCGKKEDKECKGDVGKEESLNMDNSNESSMSPSEPMDCNSTPNISPAHLPKCNSSNEDVAMSETSVCIYLVFTSHFLSTLLDQFSIYC